MELEALINQARGGDVKAFVELTRRFQQAAYGSALTLVQDFQVAEDVVQEAFLAVSPITLIDGLASTAIDGRTG
jgi:DNA-directed RNA polymerase specialized sigma24 family protein